ncbi:MAG: Glycosyltransferase Gtf1 [Acidobacteria bacterium]|nr:Glycosyltransferase Gtf1 [Acidobacteriota bacterium]
MSRTIETHSVKNLLIVSSAIHYRHDGRLFSYAPYAREIDLWADLFPELIIAAPCREAAPPPDCSPFSRSNISILPQKETGGDTLGAKLKQMFSLPALIFSLCRAMLRADTIHVRCPGNLGLLGVALAPLFSRRLVAKYAGQWTPYPGEPLTWRWQRAMLRSRWWRGPVTVYGDWPNQPAHVVPFFTSVLNERQAERARIAAARRKLGGKALRVLFVGRLSAAKNVNAIVNAVALLKARGISVECDIVGEGPERARLEKQAEESGVNDRVNFAGGVDFDRALDFYERADALALVSETEGWPKAIAEAMAFGLVCIGSDRGLIPKMLGEGRGIVVPPGDAEALASALQRVIENPDECSETSRRAAEWGQRYSLEGLQRAIGELLAERWQTPKRLQLWDTGFAAETQRHREDEESR